LKEGTQEVLGCSAAVSERDYCLSRPHLLKKGIQGVLVCSAEVLGCSAAVTDRGNGYSRTHLLKKETQEGLCFSAAVTERFFATRGPTRWRTEYWAAPQWSQILEVVFQGQAA